MSAPLDMAALQAFGTALLIGALIGLEREKHRAAEGNEGSAGLRTFIAVAEVGAVAGWLAQTLASPWVIATALGAVALVVVAGYVMATRQGSPELGLTTEIAMLLVCLLGAMTTVGQSSLAIALAVVTAAVLAYKQSLHGLVERVGWDDVYAGLRLLIAAFVVLPLLPDRPIDPWGALNPAYLWRFVLLISGLSLVGYVGTRWLGERKGAALTGLTGGLASSTAVTLAFARQSREAGESVSARMLAGGLLLAWGVMFVRVVIEVLVVNPSLVVRVLPPFVAMAGACAVFAAMLILRRQAASDTPAVTRDVPLNNPFSLTAATKFAAFFAVVLVVVKVAQRHFSTGGLYVVAVVAGLTDVDAIALSMAEQARSGDPAVAINAIVIAAVANTLTKAGMAAVLGSAGLRRHALPPIAAVLAAGAAGAWLL
jgi:uncharacterized membrane protein (DUF4010 family)